LTLGCLEHKYAYAIPYEKIEEIVPFLNKTEKSDRYYWHIHLQPIGDGEYQLIVPRKEPLNLKPYRLQLEKFRTVKAV
jgi:hypothetical protein